MSSIRRAGVIADYGSLEAYRDHVIRERDECSARIDRGEVWPELIPPGRVTLLMRQELAEWNADLDWVNAEIAKDV